MAYLRRRCHSYCAWRASALNPAPQILRRDSGFVEKGPKRSPQYQFIGDAYVHGIMHGEAYDEARLETIALV